MRLGRSNVGFWKYEENTHSLRALSDIHNNGGNLMSVQLDVRNKESVNTVACLDEAATR